MSNKRRRPYKRTVNVYFQTDDQKEEFKKLAERKGLSMSEYLRDLAMYAIYDDRFNYRSENYYRHN